MTDQNNLPTKTEFLLYQTDDDNIRIETRMENETVWLTQAQMCKLFDKNKRTISEHIRNIFSEGELQEEQVVRKFRTTAADGKKYLVAHYNLDVIISVGYRVRSHRGTQFRIWATQRLREYIIKGFAMDDERLKQVGKLDRCITFLLFCCEKGVRRDVASPWGLLQFFAEGRHQEIGGE